MYLQPDDKKGRPSGPTAPSTKWTCPINIPILERGVIHIWYIDTLSSSEQLKKYHEMLSERERKKANKYYHEVDRVAFIIRRGALKTLAGHYLSITPQVLEFKTGSFGKPYINERQNQDDLQFNISASNNLILLAFTRGGNLGVDVEYVNPIDSIDSIVRHFFSPSEKALLLSQKPVDKVQSFYRIWTLKEALLKALGIGLSQGADLFGTCRRPNGCVEIVDNQLDWLKPALWSIKTINCDGEYCAATALDAGGDIKLQYFRLHSCSGFIK